MNIQIFGVKKSFDTKKAERYFKERRIKVQQVDLKEKELSRGEFDSVVNALGGIENVIDWEGKNQELLALLKVLSPAQLPDKVFENQQVLKMPVVRNGRKATVGYAPEVWKAWEKE